MKVIMKIIAVFLAVTVTVSMTGCAYTHPNPIARDASYGATIGALPGLALMSVTPTVEEDDVDIDTELGFFGLSLIVTGIGAVGGLAIGTVVGIIQWMYETATWQPPVEETAPAVEYNQEEPTAVRQEEPTAVRQNEEPAAVETAGEDIAEDDYAPQAIQR